MLTLIIPGDECFDEESGCFLTLNDTVLELEHSLLSLSKWESKFQKPFLSPGEKTVEEILYYVECMILTETFDKDLFLRFTDQNFKQINDYIESSESATTFGQEPNSGGRGEVITSELIYYWMVAFTIPFECQTWHLNRLFSLIKICNIKNSKQKNMPKHEVAARNRELNAQRKALLGTTG